MNEKDKTLLFRWLAILSLQLTVITAELAALIVLMGRMT